MTTDRDDEPGAGAHDASKDNGSNDNASKDDAVLARLSDALEPEAPPASLRAALLQRLHTDQRYTPFCREVSLAFGIAESAVLAAFGRIQEPHAWQPGLWPGSTCLTTPELAQAGAIIARVAPGTLIPSHRHEVREQTYVLDGVLVEDGARRVTAGQLLVAEPGSRHALAVDGPGDCLVVFSDRGDTIHPVKSL